MPDGLDDAPWRQLDHAYGSASKIPSPVKGLLDPPACATGHLPSKGPHSPAGTPPETWRTTLERREGPAGKEHARQPAPNKFGLEVRSSRYQNGGILRSWSPTLTDINTCQ